MPFIIDNKEVSEQEVALEVKKLKQQRHDWCEKKAREYFATKEREKYYHVTYYSPDIEYDMYHSIPEEITDSIRKKMEEDIVYNGPYESKEKELSAIRDIIDSLQIDWSEHLDKPSDEIRSIDYDDFVYCYSIKAFVFRCTDTQQIANTSFAVRLTDEEYIQVLTELLYYPIRLSLDGIRKKLPEIAKKIRAQCVHDDVVTAIFLKEMNEDVDKILEQVGGMDNTPYHYIFDHPFARIAEHFANK